MPATRDDPLHRKVQSIFHDILVTFNDDADEILVFLTTKKVFVLNGPKYQSVRAQSTCYDRLRKIIEYVPRMDDQQKVLLQAIASTNTFRENRATVIELFQSAFITPDVWQEDPGEDNAATSAPSAPGNPLLDHPSREQDYGATRPVVTASRPVGRIQPQRIVTEEIGEQPSLLCADDDGDNADAGRMPTQPRHDPDNLQFQPSSGRASGTVFSGNLDNGRGKSNADGNTHGPLLPLAVVGIVAVTAFVVWRMFRRH